MKKVFFIKLILSVVLVLHSFNFAHAILLNDLYTIEMQAVDKTDQERNQLFIKGFEQVLLKLIDQSVITEPRIQAAKEEIDKYISSFSYKEEDDVLYIRIIFNESMINHLLKESGILYLGKNRPVTLVLLLVNNSTGFKLINEEEYHTYVNTLDKLASEQAIPLVFPLLDLEERNNLIINEILNSSTDILSELSLKYNADLILIGKIINFAGEYIGEWNILNGITFNKEFTTKTINEQYERLIKDFKLSLIEKNVHDMQTESERQSIRIKVIGINSLEMYNKIFSYLKELDNVTAVKVIEVTNDSAVFELNAKTDSDLVKKEINSNNILEQAIINENKTVDGISILNYKVTSWIPIN